MNKSNSIISGTSGKSHSGVIRKREKSWEDSTPRKHRSLNSRTRKSPGMGGKGKFYRIEIRPKNQFVIFRAQDVGEKGGLERISGRRKDGGWDTVSWLVSKEDAHMNEKGELIIDDVKARTVLRQFRGKIMHVKGDIFEAEPRKNTPEGNKPTLSQRHARKSAIRKAQKSKQ